MRETDMSNNGNTQERVTKKTKEKEAITEEIKMRNKQRRYD
jgi:hypothetical protein